MSRRITTLAGFGLLVLMPSAFSPAGIAADPAAGSALFSANCARCHGMDGGKRKWGAFDLRRSTMTNTAIAQRIRTGKGIMPAFRGRLNEAQIEALVAYVRTLRVGR